MDAKQKTESTLKRYKMEKINCEVFSQTGSPVFNKYAIDKNLLKDIHLVLASVDSYFDYAIDNPKINLKNGKKVDTHINGILLKAYENDYEKYKKVLARLNQFFLNRGGK